MNRDPRRHFLQGSLALAGLGLLSGCGLPAHPARPADAPVVGVLSVGSEEGDSGAFRQGLRELGYVEGQNIVLEYRFAAGRDGRLQELAAELVGLRVEVIFASSGPSALAARAATDTIPIVSTSADPVGLGLVASLARPGGNVTGLSYSTSVLAGKRLELLKEVSPAARAVAVLWYAPNAASGLQLQEVQEAAPRLSLQVQPVGVQGPEGFDSALEAAARGQADAVYVIGGPEMTARQTRVLEFVGDFRRPAIYSQREWVEGGGLMAYGVNFPDVHRRAAYYVDRIIKGAKPADLPIEQPTKFELVINLKTAQTLGLTIPQSVLAQATEIIQ